MDINSSRTGYDSIAIKPGRTNKVPPALLQIFKFNRHIVMVKKDMVAPDQLVKKKAYARYFKVTLITQVHNKRHICIHWFSLPVLLCF